METRKRTLAGIWLFWIGFFSVLSSWGEVKGSETDRTQSPYFFIQNEDSDVDRLPLKSTSVSVNIAGVIADVTVTQIYENQGTRPMEAIYVFPASTRAAVHALKMTVGERTVKAVIEKREKARRQYEQAKAEGKSASLLEQHRPNVFQMNVGNILPKDVITVELRYTELLVPTKGVYEFAYPTVVGPRYAGDQGDGKPPKEGWISNPYLRQGELPSYRFKTSVHIDAGMPIQDVSCPSHKVHIRYNGEAIAQADLDPSEIHGGNRDFILRYRLSGSRVQSGLLLYPGEKENFFLMMIEPPQRVAMDQVPPREYIFIVDVSGSMHGFPLDISKNLFRSLIGGLRPVDRFNVLLFAGSSSMLSERSIPATRENLKSAIDTIERQRGGGGTRLLPALKRVFDTPKPEGYCRTLVIVTDGYVAVEAEAFELIRKNLNHANVFPFGIGSSVNRFLIEGMARAGMGEPFIVTNPEAAGAQAKRFQEMIEKPVLTGIHAEFDGFDAYDVEPGVVPDVMSDRPVIVFGKWRGRPAGTLKLTGRLGERPYVETIHVDPQKADVRNTALKFLWARHRIASLSDDNFLNPDDDRVSEVTRLGLTYSLLTAYTSFVAVDTRVRMVDGEAVTVKQPLPLPQGVSDLAVGGDKAVPGVLRSKTAWMPSLNAATPVAEEAKGRVGNVSTEKSQKEEGNLVLDRLDVSGGISADEIRKKIEPRLPAIQSCLKGHKERIETVGLRIVLEIKIGADGRVLLIQIKDNGKDRKWIQDCLNRELVGVKFIAPSTVKDETATIVLLFS